jgi:hypothetical protein
MPLAVLAALVAVAIARHDPARLAPTSFEPLTVRGTGFHARERVRVRVTRSTGDAVVRRVRATGRGSFVLAFAGVQACGGIRRPRRVNDGRAACQSTLTRGFEPAVSP